MADLTKSTPHDRERDRLATLDARFRTYLETRSLTRTAKEHGVSRPMIAKQCAREMWKERAIEVDHKQRLTREAVASRRTLDQLERVDDVLDEALEELDQAPSDVDPLHRAGMVVSVLERAQKARGAAHETLPPEAPTAELDLKLLTDAEFETWRYAGDLREALAAASPLEALRRLRARTEPVPPLPSASGATP